MRKATRVSILMLASCIAATSAAAQAPLSASDSASIALMIAERVAPELRSIGGADSTNAVCVRIEGSKGLESFLRTIDSALRAVTGGAIVAPMSISPMRAIVIDSLTGRGDSAWVRWRTKGGGLTKGEMAWGHHEQWRFVRRDSIWTGNPVRGVIGDGYIRADMPKPPDPPACLSMPAG